MLSLYCRTQNTSFRYHLLCRASFTLNSNKCRMVYEVYGNPHLDSRDWSMSSNILNSHKSGNYHLIEKNKILNSKSCLSRTKRISEFKQKAFVLLLIKRGTFVGTPDIFRMLHRGAYTNLAYV